VAGGASELTAVLVPRREDLHASEDDGFRRQDARPRLEAAQRRRSGTTQEEVPQKEHTVGQIQPAVGVRVSDGLARGRRASEKKEVEDEDRIDKFKHPVCTHVTAPRSRELLRAAARRKNDRPAKAEQSYASETSCAIHSDHLRGPADEFCHRVQHPWNAENEGWTAKLPGLFW
jgi:hypothetical protein